MTEWNEAAEPEKAFVREKLPHITECIGWSR
jgi:hypothetical protein